MICRLIFVYTYVRMRSSYFELQNMINYVSKNKICVRHSAEGFSWKNKYVLIIWTLELYNVDGSTVPLTTVGMIKVRRRRKHNIIHIVQW